MEKANLNNPSMNYQDPYSSPPSYDQATGSSINQPQPQPQNQSQPQQRSYPSPPPGFVPADNYPNIPPIQPQPIYQTNYHHQQAPPPPPQVVIFQNHALPLGPRSSYITCPFCHIQKLTRVEPEPGSKTHLMAALLCIFGFWCCACLPYCMDSCMNINHYCGNCNKFLGTYNSGTM